MLISNETFMRRCFDLALLGKAKVSPNPMVGSVLVYHGRIIGEGYHQVFGGAHAEVNAVNSVAPSHRHLIPESTLYVSLEPCCFYGKTPPCTDLIISQRIPRVVVSCLDDTPEVSGKGVAQLRAAGVEVVTGVLEEQGRRLTRARSVFVLEHRPYVILKYARSRNGQFGAPGRQLWITNPYSQRLVHKWRSEVDAILVGSGTARIDNPQLSNRLYFGSSPLRVVLDRNLSLPPTLHLFDNDIQTLVVTRKTPPGAPATQGPQYLQLDPDVPLLPALLEKLASRRIGTLLVEGGRQVIQNFLQSGLWDEARVLTGSLFLEEEFPAPEIAQPPAVLHEIGDDQLAVYYK